MFSSLTLGAIVALLLAAGAPQAPPFQIEPGPDGRWVATPAARRSPGEPAGIMRMAPDRGEIVKEADAIVHVPTGIRLPRVHRGCRLALVLPLGGEGRPYSYERGAMAEYDCTPSRDLSQVAVSFETGVPQLRRGDRGQALIHIANQLNRDIAKTDRSVCVPPIPSPNPLHAGLIVAQCGIRWSDPRSPDPHTYGAATMVLGKGTSFVRFSRKCVDAQCEASLAPFAAFFDSFDVRALAQKAVR